VILEAKRSDQLIPIEKPFPAQSQATSLDRHAGWCGVGIRQNRGRTRRNIFQETGMRSRAELELAHNSETPGLLVKTNRANTRPEHVINTI